MANDGTVGFQMALTLGGETIARAQDVELDLSATEVETTSRSDAGWYSGLPGQRAYSLSGDQLWVPSDAGLDAVLDALLARDEVAMTLTSPGGTVFSGNVFITSVKLGQSLNGAVVMPFAAKGTGALVKGSAS